MLKHLGSRRVLLSTVHQKLVKQKLSVLNVISSILEFCSLFHSLFFFIS